MLNRSSKGVFDPWKLDSWNMHACFCFHLPYLILNIHLCIWQTLLSKATCIAVQGTFTFLSILDFPGNRTHDLGVRSVIDVRSSVFMCRWIGYFWVANFQTILHQNQNQNHIYCDRYTFWCLQWENDFFFSTVKKLSIYSTKFDWSNGDSMAKTFLFEFFCAIMCSLFNNILSVSHSDTDLLTNPKKYCWK